MAGFSFNNALLLLAVVGCLWFAARFILGPKRGAPSLKSMFSRQAPAFLKGIGKETIATLLNDSCQFVIASPDLRGLILAGPFAVEAATRTSTVTLIVLCEDISGYANKEWLTRWAYPARGHLVVGHDVESSQGDITHTISLRGAPPVRFHFVPLGGLDIPQLLLPALSEGSTGIEDPAGIAENLRLHWAEQIRMAAAKV